MKLFSLVPQPRLSKCEGICVHFTAGRCTNWSEKRQEVIAQPTEAHPTGFAGVGSASGLPAMLLEAEPDAIFFSKFENANGHSRSSYRQLAHKQTHVLVAAVKSSGSLFLATARDGNLVVSSKNGMDNVYADCGHLVLVRHLQQAHGAAWFEAYRDLAGLLEHRRLSLGCELVTRSLGDHAEMPATDHLVVNAVLDRRTMAAVSPLLTLRICRHFGLVAPGMYMFKGPDAADRFLQTYDSLRWKIDTTWDELHSAMSRVAWAVVPMPYVELHSQNLEGYVCSWIPASCELDGWAEYINSDGVHFKSFIYGLPASPATASHLAPSVDELVSAGANDDGLRAAVRSVLMSLRIPGITAVESSHDAQSRAQVQALKERLKHVLASSELRAAADALSERGKRAPGSLPAASSDFGGESAEAWRATGFLAMIRALDDLHVRYELKVFPTHDQGACDADATVAQQVQAASSPGSEHDVQAKKRSQLGADETMREGELGAEDWRVHVVVHVLQDSSFPKYEKYR